MDIRSLRRLSTGELENLRTVFREKAALIEDVDGNDMSMSNIKLHIENFKAVVPESTWHLTRIQRVMAEGSTVGADPCAFSRAVLALLIQMASECHEFNATVEDIATHHGDNPPPRIADVLCYSLSQIDRIEALDKQVRRALGFTISNADLRDTATQSQTRPQTNRRRGGGSV